MISKANNPLQPDTDRTTALIASSMPLVKYLSAKVKKRLQKHDFDSIHAAAMVGAFDAAKRFDNKPDSDFPRFARKRIYGAIMDWLREDDPLTRYTRAKINKGELKPIAFTQIDSNMPTATTHHATWDDFSDARKRLAPQDRVILALYCVEHYTMKQIGQIIGTSLDAIWRRIDKMRNTLQEPPKESNT